jgi:hypothetical protein
MQCGVKKERSFAALRMTALELVAAYRHYAFKEEKKGAVLPAAPSLCGLRNRDEEVIVNTYRIVAVYRHQAH